MVQKVDSYGDMYEEESLNECIVAYGQIAKVGDDIVYVTHHSWHPSACRGSIKEIIKHTRIDWNGKPGVPFIKLRVCAYFTVTWGKEKGTIYRRNVTLTCLNRVVRVVSDPVWMELLNYSRPE